VPALKSGKRSFSCPHRFSQSPHSNGPWDQLIRPARLVSPTQILLVGIDSVSSLNRGGSRGLQSTEHFQPCASPTTCAFDLLFLKERLGICKPDRRRALWDSNFQIQEVMAWLAGVVWIVVLWIAETPLHLGAGV
jgi:hypothetical protein